MTLFEEKKKNRFSQDEYIHKQYHSQLKNIAAIISLASISENSRILDIGCGTGVAFSELLLKKPSKLVGVDICEKAIQTASTSFKDSRIKLIQSNLYDMKENEFDIAFIYNSYVEFSNKVQFAEKISSVLSKYGRFIIAFNQSRNSVNYQQYSNGQTSKPTELYSVYREATIFSKWFHIDIMVDTSQLYILSGIKKFQ